MGVSISTVTYLPNWHYLYIESKFIVGFRKVTERAKKQMDNLWHTTNIYLHPTIHQYAEKLAAKLPGNLKVLKEKWKVKIEYVKSFLKKSLCGVIHFKLWESKMN